MSNFIEQLYYGNINPQDRNTENNKTMQKKMATLIQNEDFLKNVLTGEAKQRFIAFDDVWSTVNNETNLDSFILGFRLGLISHMIHLCQQMRRSRILPMSKRV